MAQEKSTTPEEKLAAFQPEHRQTAELVFAVCRNEYREVPARLCALFADVADLYAGRWPSHEACAVTYHNFNHALDVCLATARMIAGWNLKERAQFLDSENFQLAMAAALFHDSGYIKNKGDLSGLGGKFTLIHVERGIVIARGYLNNNGWREEEVDAVCRMISITDYANLPEIAPLFLDLKLKAVAQMVATADLIAQIANTDYVSRLDDLFAEFNEVYTFENPAYLAQKGTKVYRTAQEIKDGTISFYEQFFMPTLGKLGRMDRFLDAFFGTRENPYKRNIANNLSSELLEVRSQWRRLTDIPGRHNPGAISLTRPDRRKGSKNSPPDSIESFHHLLHAKLMRWFKDCDGKACKPGALPPDQGGEGPTPDHLGQLDQVIPDSFYELLLVSELKSLLKISIFLQKVKKSRKSLESVLEMGNEILGCEASSILLADLEEKKLFIALPTGAKKKLVAGRRRNFNQGLSGWVYSNGLEAIVNDVSADVRFAPDIDKEISFTTRSILAVPLHLHGNCIGVLEALNKRQGDFTRNDANVLAILANMFARFMNQLLEE